MTQLFVPYVRKGRLYLGDGEVDINHCTLGDLKDFFPVPSIYYQVKDDEGNLVFMFIFDIELGEVQLMVDPIHDKVLHLEIELFDDLDLEKFLKLLDRWRQRNYQYLQDEGEVYLLFNRNFLARLSANHSKVSGLIFVNRDFLKICDTALTKEIIRQSECLGLFN